MTEMNFYYLEKPTLLNLKRIFSSGDIPFIRLSKFLESLSKYSEPKLNRQEKIGYYKRKEGNAILEEFWSSSQFIKFLNDSTGLKPKLRSATHISYSAGDYSLLHTEEDESERLVVAYDFTESWKQEWGGYVGKVRPGIVMSNPATFNAESKKMVEESGYDLEIFSMGIEIYPSGTNSHQADDRKKLAATWSRIKYNR